jgi:VanZ family protein
VSDFSHGHAKNDQNHPAFQISTMIHRFLNLAIFHWIAFTFWLALLFVLSGLPGEAAPQHLFPHQDKVLHFVFYLGGAAVLTAALSSTWPLPRFMGILLAVLLLAICGAADEYRQQFAPSRAGMDPLDWSADIAGALAGAVILTRMKSLYGLPVPKPQK